ncbi:MAG: 50S ribosomal protein L33 [Sedimentisphaerales bacterium]|nr:50S ribosomal protein L33 [Sedimentisphaerales bacterium]
MAKKTKREYFWMECTECGERNYRTEVNTMGGVPKLELKKFCSRDQRRTVHKLRRK